MMAKRTKSLFRIRLESMGNKSTKLLFILFFIQFSISAGISLIGAFEESSQPKLSEILKKTSEYCQRLERSALDYVCIEEVKEETLHTHISPDHARDQGYVTAVRRKRTTYTYDYQMIRKNKRIKENRTLIKKNGKKCCIENAELEIEFIKFANEIFGPVGLLSLQRQSLYDYRIFESENTDQGPYLIIEAVHKNPSARDSLCGKIWFRKDHFDIVRIEWDQSSLGNFAAIQEIAKQREEEPSIRIISEFAVEKNGLRFPSQTITEMAFINKKGKKDVRARITVTYSHYKFFTVETEIEY